MVAVIGTAWPLGYFGKLPARGDFVRAGEHTPLMAQLDRWAEQAAELLARDPDWKRTYDAAPPMHFAFLGSRSRGVVAGHILASRDSSERRFPFMVASRFEVAQPLPFLARSPLALSRPWVGMSRQARQAVTAGDPSPVLRELAETRVSLSVEPTHYEAPFLDFLDLQDIGVRSYTYISCMRYVIEACFSLPRPVRVVVLDRPNPLGGEKVDGPFLDRKWRSYVGAYETSYVHGLTIGEIARWAVATPGVLELDEATRRRGTLDVVTLRGWRRSMTWNLTGLNWTPTSPMINSSKAALGYAMSGLGCMDSGFSHSSTADQNFRFLTYPRRKAADLMAAFGNAVPGLTLQPQQQADGTQGVYLAVTDYAVFRPTAISLHLFRQACVWAPNPFAGLTGGKRELFIKHWGREADFEAFQRASDLMGVQRNLKVIGIFGRICHRDGKPRYLTDVPRFFAYIEAVLARRPELAPLAELLASLRPSAGVAQ